MKNKQGAPDWLTRYRWFWELLLFSALSVFWLFLWASQGKIYMGDDLSFHLNRVQGLVQQLVTGHWSLGHIATTTFSGWGYPINLFYPAYTLVPLAMLQVWLGGVRAYTVFLFLVTLLTLYVTRFVGQRLLGSYFQGVLMAILYSFSQYRILDFFARGALAEGIVFAFLPLVLYGTYELAIGDVHQSYWLVVGMALIGLTHVVSLLLASVLVLLTLGLFFLHRTDFKRRLGALGLVIGATVLLTLTFLAPLAEQLRSLSALSILQFKLTQSAVPMGTFLVNSAVNQMWSGQINLGWLMLMLLLLSLVMWRRLTPVLRYWLVLAVVFVWLVTTWFPWAVFQRVLGMIQFPWRFLAIASLLIALVGARALTLVLPRLTRRGQWGILTIVAVFGVVLNTTSYIAFYQNPYGNAITQADYHRVATTSTSTDYVRPQSLVAMPALRAHSVAVMNPGHGLRQLSRRVSSDQFRYLVHSPRAQTVKLPHLYYPGYRVTVNGQRQRVRHNGMAILQARLKAGHNHIQVAYQATGIQRVSAWISALAWLGLVIFCGQKWRRNWRNHHQTN
ncbi:glycosyltransferase family protein [Levilactobacillus angrenensis]|uniref:Membrane protein 6-pyruvoyl-tetrahydropterin synthase-related domain-containing protein n=1 Tax=Levilactobacillus angrenensis TaxID=2486020 RepID=A0ABW1U8U7_9LACO|nr:hypothetical protein [Levilactobacillus angrenensis]